MGDPAAMDGGIRHVAWIYRTVAEYPAAVRDFVLAGVGRSEPTMVALPADGAQLPWLPSSPLVSLTDMRQLGGNPARIMPALRAFADQHHGQRVRYVGQPAWMGRTTAELAEAARHEALINLALAGDEISILCPYSEADLPPSVIADARSTHPLLLTDGRELPSEGYLGSSECPALLGKPLLAPASAQVLSYERDLRPVRSLVAAVAERAGLDSTRGTDLVIAASEVAANTLRHTSGGGVIRLWTTSDEVLCQIEDSGYIADPLAGHARPAGDLPGGQGLWLVNQICDLVEIRSSKLGTTIRLHMYR